MSQIDAASETGGLLTRQLDDLEYNGALNHATGQGAKFALLLSMLEQNALYRPHIAADDKVEPFPDIQAISYYRPLPLAANSSYWQEVVQTEHFIQTGELQNAKLWLVMHPEPLSLLNDAKHIPQVILENCAYSVRQRAEKNNPTDIPQDATGLYDILADINRVEPIQVQV